MTEALRRNEILSAGECRLLEAGMKSGMGAEVMGEISRQMMDAAEAALQHRVAQVEPALVLSASVLVGIILMSVMMPLMHILQALG